MPVPCVFDRKLALIKPVSNEKVSLTEMSRVPTDITTDALVLNVLAVRHVIADSESHNEASQAESCNRGALE